MNNVSVRAFALFVTIAGTILPSIAQAQVMIDTSRITCSQYLALPPDQSGMLAAWLSGWFNQKQGTFGSILMRTPGTSQTLRGGARPIQTNSL